MKILINSVVALTALALPLSGMAQDSEDTDAAVQYKARGIIQAVQQETAPSENFQDDAGGGAVEPVTPEPSKEVSFDVQSVNFEFGSANLTMGAKRQLDEFGIAATSPELEALSLKIVGHTDDVGSAAYNQQLSERRASSVADYLVDQFGITSDRLQVSGKGESSPLIEDTTVEARAENRRVEMIFLIN